MVKKGSRDTWRYRSIKTEFTCGLPVLSWLPIMHLFHDNAARVHRDGGMYHVMRKSAEVQKMHQVHRGMFTTLVARWPGNTHDSHIFRNSKIYDNLEQTHQSLEDGVLLGATVAMHAVAF
ncbi:uncharacterized protein LOC116302115 isoform X2 [Actinia tenebrosa]|uniref:Uncharacterized protein LOC116302115 isoform X2 n=1 Tax=Actinia tenebrosa TaxID=6105 RepID=A0A6P8IJU6_ACTTE|nr:uncharacterized protein LOC116302115 isoform X2 [Actinia tenebrosa]